MPNTVDIPQVYAVVPNAKPNAGQPSTKDATPEQIASFYESAADRNKFSDDEKTKLANLLEIDDSDDVPEGVIHFFMDGAEKSKLAGIEDNAQVNPANSDFLSQGSTNLYMTALEKSKLAGIQAGAQVNPASTDALSEGLTNKYQSTEDKRRNAVPVAYNASAIPSPLNTQLARTFIITMDTNIASLSLANGAFDGQSLLLIIKQDATGGRTLVYNPANTQAGKDVGIPVLDGTANSRDYHCIMWNATNSKWDFMPNIRRYP